MEFPWYEEVDADTPLTQGDILSDFYVPLIVETDTYPFFKANAGKLDVIVMTQACDLENGKVKELSFCSLDSLNQTVKEILTREIGGNVNFEHLTSKQQKRPSKIVEELKQGNHLNFHLLNCTDSSRDNADVRMAHKVVLLKKTYQVPISAVYRLIEHESRSKRLRLLPPYREHLAQAYANTYSRIGLPADINTNDIEINLTED